MDDFP